MKTEKDALNTVEFFDLMQNYRLCPTTEQERVVRRFEDVKKYIRENFDPK